MTNKILLIYDKECPACDYYCNIVRINDSVGELVLVDAREDSSVMDEITAKDWDIDQGMVLKVEDELYYGSEAIHALSAMGGQSGFFNKINYCLFRSKSRAKILYPILRSLRNLLLKILGKTKINNLNIKGNDKF
jgi:predicted DCC family thiol-disulfide oxidoreductase YuxK